MNSRKYLKFLFVLPMALVIACGSDDESTTTLTSTQSKEVANILFSGFGSAVSGGSSSSSKISGRFDPNFDTFTSSVNETENCEVSGSVTTTGDITVETDDSSDSSGSLSSEYSFNEQFDACTETDDDGSNVTIDGSIALTGDMNFTVSGSTVTGTSTTKVEGSISVSGDNITNGTCSVDMTYTVTVNGNTYTYTANGTVCGESIDFEDSETDS